MKTSLVKTFLFVTLLITSFGCEEDNGSPSVYVCTGDYAYAYHANSYCSGLNNCKGEIVFVSTNKAKKMNRKKPCDICY